MAIIYGLKVNLSVTIVAMLNHTHLAAEATSHAHDDAHAVSDSHGEGAAAEVDEAVLCFGGENTTESKNAEVSEMDIDIHSIHLHLFIIYILST